MAVTPGMPAASNQGLITTITPGLPTTISPGQTTITPGVTTVNTLELSPTITPDHATLKKCVLFGS